MALYAVSPIDGRYHEKTQPLSEFFSEYALIKKRVYVEIEYLLALRDVIGIRVKDDIRSIYQEFTERDAQQVKEWEEVINHDVKAVEYYIKTFVDPSIKEFVHFGLTSQDINNTAIPLLIKDAMHQLYLPLLQQVVTTLQEFGTQWCSIPMLARTHGQPATPTRVGMPFLIWADRLKKQIQQLLIIPHTVKFGGATGQLNAHYAAYPHIDWLYFADNFCAQSLGMGREQFTTQISQYDNLAALFDALKRINVILLDACKDIWHYISIEYFTQQVNPAEVGSSAMPHKVNPIDFENAEGNLGIANALFEHLASKLPVSRLHRDLSDSTTLRNVGVPFAHTYLALLSIGKGLSKIDLNYQAVVADLNRNTIVVSEAIQTILRREGYPKAYEALKALTRNQQHITQQVITEFIDTLNVPTAVKEELAGVTPFNYIGQLPKGPAVL